MRKQKGFSLIELLIVVAIILIIAAIAIPNLLKSRIAANETSAVGSIRTINTAQVSYATTYPQVGYADALSKLGGDGSGSAAAGLLPQDLGVDAANKSGYDFALGAASNGGAGYDLTATPTTVGTTGKRAFYSDASGVIRVQPDGTTAKFTDNPLQ